MRFVVNNELEHAIYMASKIAGNGVIDIMADEVEGTVTVRASSPGIGGSFTRKAIVNQSGRACVNAQALRGFTSSGNPTMKAARVNLIGEKSSGTIRLRMDANYPVVLERPDESDATILPGTALKEALATVGGYAHADAAHMLSGVFVLSGDDRLFVTATDSFSLAYAWMDAPGCPKSKFYLPKIVSEISDFFPQDVSVVTSGGNVFFTFSDGYVYSSSLNFEFPWEAVRKMVYDDHVAEISVSHTELSQILRELGTIPGKQMVEKRINFRTEGHNLIIESSDHNEIGKAEYKVPCNILKEDQPFKTSINRDMVWSLLGTISKAIKKPDYFGMKLAANTTDIKLSIGKTSGWIIVTGDVSIMFLLAKMVDIP